MADLKETIEILIEKMKKYRSLYERNEMATRGQIIEPILKGLGWNIENPEEIQPNVSFEEGVPDYSLLKNDKNILFIEAKKLAIDIEQKGVIRQLAKYCFGEGMKYGVLTNGAIWLLFRAFQEGTTIAERIIWKTDIENDEVTATIRRLNTISRENITDIDNLIKKLQILDEIWHSLLDEPKDLIKGFIPVFEILIKEGYPQYEFDQTEIEDFIKERVKELISPTEESIIETISGVESTENVVFNPRKMKIGSDTYEIRNSYDILVNTAEWLIKKAKLRKENCPIVSGHKRNLVNIQPKHRYEDNFRAPKRLSNGLYIETHYSTTSCITNARKLLERCGYSKNILELKN
ncbi:MAG: type I restriction enzyme HsdR N-terminal domain-containing protein [Actinomycetia bacterium]|nr:type I restriction enzyme HsdR N-terminal domain-containing protein [Actinomycetes bacterium]